MDRLVQREPRPAEVPYTRRPVQLHHGKRQRDQLHCRIQAVPQDVGRGPDAFFREIVGLVLLDVEDGVGSAVELSGWSGGQIHARISLPARLGLLEASTKFREPTRVLLKTLRA